MADYGNTPAGASASLLLAEKQRVEGKFEEANKTLQGFIDKDPAHELVPAAKMAIAANLQSQNKTDEALSFYKQIAASYPKSFAAPLALISQVPLLKEKNQPDAARRVCETVLSQYRSEFLGRRSDAGTSDAQTGSGAGVIECTGWQRGYTPSWRVCYAEAFCFSASAETLAPLN